jgi:hypothetical protein
MLNQHPEQKSLVIMIRFKSDLIWSNNIMPRRRTTRMAVIINETDKEILVKRRFSKTPAK